jgi:chemotaxis protein MotA
VSRSALGGVGLALTGIAVGLYLDGGKIGQMLQPTAALIVFGGTLGAVVVQFPFPVVMQAVQQLKGVFLGGKDPASELIQELSRFALKARRNGLVSLDRELELIQDPFLRKSLTLAVDGIHAAELRQMMEVVMDSTADRENLLPKVFEAAGGFAPTIGILGAVIGLIQVMQRLENINEVGKGIAVAFVATLYGVGAANILFLPCAGRIKIQLHRKQMLREMILEGVLYIVANINPRALETKLSAYLDVPVPEAPSKLVTG